MPPRPAARPVARTLTHDPACGRSSSSSNRSIPAALLREATKHYEQHVIAWYALGRVTEARSARETIMNYRRALVAESAHNRLASLANRPRRW
jgi:hypothetical protein